MKKRVVFFAVIILALLFAGCAEAASGDNGDDGIIEITERFFVNQMNEILLNHEMYLGRTIRYEGMFFNHPWTEGNLFLVIRHAAGCCSPEEMMGFEVLMGEFEPFEDNTWVEVTGVMEMDDGFLVLRVTSIYEMDERGLEFVS